MARRFVDVAGEHEIGEGERRVFELDGSRVLICRIEGSLFALEDVCSHDDGPLGEGTLEGHEIVCPRHGARFDVRTGEVLAMPAVVGIATFPVQVREGRVLVETEVD